MARVGHKRHGTGQHAVGGLDQDEAEVEHDADREGATIVGRRTTVAMMIVVIMVVTMTMMTVVAMRMAVRSVHRGDPFSFVPAGQPAARISSLRRAHR